MVEEWRLSRLRLSAVWEGRVPADDPVEANVLLPVDATVDLALEGCLRLLVGVGYHWDSITSALEEAAQARKERGQE